MLVDSHCHLDRLNVSGYPDGLAGALDSARSKGIHGFLCIAIGRNNAQQVINLARQYPDVYATTGIHPLEFNSSSNTPPEVISNVQLAEWLAQTASHERVIGIGETGLDYYYSHESIQAQQKSFISHLEVAKSLNKPVVIHTRNASSDTLRLVRQHGTRGERAGVFHCFTEDWELAKAALDLGYYISFSGIITFKNASSLREVVKKVPIERLLLETDSPYLAPVPHRGSDNEPKYLVHVAEQMAKLLAVDYERICEETSKNFSRLFRAFMN